MELYGTHQLLDCDDDVNKYSEQRHA